MHYVRLATDDTDAATNAQIEVFPTFTITTTNTTNVANSTAIATTTATSTTTTATPMESTNEFFGNTKMMKTSFFFTYLSV